MKTIKLKLWAQKFQNCLSLYLHYLFKKKKTDSNTALCYYSLEICPSKRINPIIGCICLGYFSIINIFCADANICSRNKMPSRLPITFYCKNPLSNFSSDFMHLLLWFFGRYVHLRWVQNQKSITIKSAITTLWPCSV